MLTAKSVQSTPSLLLEPCLAPPVQPTLSPQLQAPPAQLALLVDLADSQQEHQILAKHAVPTVIPVQWSVMPNAQPANKVSRKLKLQVLQEPVSLVLLTA